MAQKVQVHLEDGLDGGPAGDTIQSSLDGRDYEIDLSTANAQRLREALRPVVTAARKAISENRRTRGTGTTHTTGSDAAETAAIRAWAKKHGHQVSACGRIPAPIRQAYHAAH